MSPQTSTWLIVPLLTSALIQAEPLCEDRARFIEAGWREPTVQDAMDDYLRDHRMRARWLQPPIPPDQIGRDYYEWLWMSGFGAGMKAELVMRFCGAEKTGPAP